MEPIFVAFLVELYPRLLLDMGEFFTENAEPTLDSSVVAKRTQIIPIDSLQDKDPYQFHTFEYFPVFEPYMVDLTKGTTRIKFPRLPPLYNMTPLDFDPINPGDDGSLEIVRWIQNLSEWCLVELLPEVKLFGRDCFLVNYKARVLWDPCYKECEHGYEVTEIKDICKRVCVTSVPIKLWRPEIDVIRFLHHSVSSCPQ